MEKYIFDIEEEAGERLDVFLARSVGEKSRSALQRLISSETALVNGKAEKPSYRLRPGDEVSLTLLKAAPVEILPENIGLDIVYEDNHLIVINKPQGMVVHPAAGHFTGTVVNGLMYHCKTSLSGINGVLRPGIVHRIDKDTSGLIVAAKNDKAHQGLSHQFSCHTIKRRYEAVALGAINQEKVINAPIGRNPKDRKKMCVTERNSRNAVTYIRPLQLYKSHTHIEARLETGRTHQIRVHLAHIGHPVLGDPVYSPQSRSLGIAAQTLHAKVLGFVHPFSGEYMEFQSELPPYFKEILQKL